MVSTTAWAAPALRMVTVVTSLLLVGANRGNGFGLVHLGPQLTLDFRHGCESGREAQPDVIEVGLRYVQFDGLRHGYQLLARQLHGALLSDSLRQHALERAFEIGMTSVPRR